MAAESGLVWMYGVASGGLKVFADGVAGVGGASPA